MIENTSQRNPLIHLAGGMGGLDRYITEMESAGQSQLINSDRLPTRASGDEKDYLALGFEFGDPDPADPLFRPAKLPQGWKRRASDHSMWSYLDDEFGRERVAIFYKGAFYDRDAHMSLTSVVSYARKVVDGTVSDPVFDDVWCTRDAFASALAELRTAAVERLALYEGSTVGWAAEHLPECRDELARVDEAIVRYGAVA